MRAVKPKRGLRILDATAGWGRDAIVLASFGADVIMLERNPIMAALLSDALRRLTQSSANNKFTLSLCYMDVMSYLPTLSKDNYPHVIYLDPMHPVREKTALVKREMQVLQNIVAPDPNLSELIKISMAYAQQRVVVKWPARLPPSVPPALSISGSTVRFDIYLPNA